MQLAALLLVGENRNEPVRNIPHLERYVSREPPILLAGENRRRIYCRIYYWRDFFDRICLW
ncbi:hypothetical protein C7S13_3036 [Burkholderia cepacia]|nr:hypothetical protein [Burkholderia cepacia]